MQRALENLEVLVLGRVKVLRRRVSRWGPGPLDLEQIGAGLPNRKRLAGRQLERVRHRPYSAPPAAGGVVGSSPSSPRLSRARYSSPCSGSSLARSTTCRRSVIVRTSSTCSLTNQS